MLLVPYNPISRRISLRGTLLLHTRLSITMQASTASQYFSSLPSGSTFHVCRLSNMRAIGMPNVQTFSSGWLFPRRKGRNRYGDVFGDAYRLAACQTVGTQRPIAHFCELGSLWTGDAELLHPKLQR